MLTDLRSVSVKFEYRSDEDDLINDFYIPCLTKSSKYDRAVGYFTAEGLSLAARGIVELLKNEGKMRLVVGALVSEEDKDQIVKGYEERLKENLAARLEEELTDCNDDVIRQRIASLAWLVSSKSLEVRVAVPVDDSNRIRSGIYHEKMGIFSDTLGNSIAFTGSSNETVGGLVGNFESNEVYVSWNENERLRIHRKISNFERLWTDNTPNLCVLEFTEATEQKILKFKGKEFPEFDPEDIRKIRVVRKNKPLGFQEAAVESWKENDFSGILAMATGSGKTFTAIMGIEKYVLEDVLTIIAVPGKEIADQWEEEIHKELPDARVVHCHSWAAGWPDRLTNIVDYYKTATTKGIGRTFVISIYDTASTLRFLKILSELSPNRLCLVCDEVHHAGASETRRIFDINARYRLALSATPDRDWDEAGTQLIKDYFRSVVYTFDIGMAIRNGRLCPYEYFVYPVVLEPSELSDYREISAKISRFINILSKDMPEIANKSMYQIINALLSRGGDKASELQRLLFRRASILKRANSKLEKLREITRNSKLGRCLVYCTDQLQVNDATRMLINDGHSALQYTSEMDSDERFKALESFRLGHSNFLVAIKCLDEGIDIPACDSAIILASSKSTREFVQRRGRVLRIHSGKEKALIHDMIVVPFLESKDGFPLESSEIQLIDAELKRAGVFAENASNKEQVKDNIDSLWLLFVRAI